MARRVPLFLKRRSYRRRRLRDAARLLPLPTFLVRGGAAEWDDVLAGLRITGHFLERDVLVDRRADALASRARLIDRLKRAVA